MVTPKTKTRIAFDFDGERRESYDRLVQIICPARWGSGIDIFGFMNDSHSLLFDFMKHGVIVIDECEYEFQESCADGETAQRIKSMLGKRSNHPVLRDMAALFGNEPFAASEYYRNTIHLPNIKAFARADGMKPEDIAEMLALDSCEKIILFPYFPLDGKSAYYELTLAVTKESFVEFLRRVKERRIEEMNEEINQAIKCKIEGYSKAALRIEGKADWKTVEQITYRAFLNAEHASGDEALLARKLRGRPSFVPELNYVAEIDGSVIGNIMYTRSKVVNDDGEWETLTFGPVSVLPKYQRQGAGGALIRRTLYTARELGYRAVLIYGHESYYPRFGFKPASDFGITTADGKNFPAFMALPLTDGALDGVCGRLICDEVYTALDKTESDKLNAKLAEPMDVDEYINAQPEHIRQDLRTVRLMIKTALQIHGVGEGMSWRMPTYRRGKNLIHFAAQKNHLGIYPGPEAIAQFAPRLTKFKTSKGAIQIPYKDLGEHLSLITEIASWCGRETDNG
jgi:predicted N-acetyltransferase YhbS/uncharacterized protein YdhG (YjbR/CyaY superfamily)